MTKAKAVVPGLDFSSPIDVFKDQVDTAFANAGVVAGRPTALDTDDRAIALNLAGNWALKLLVALALECGSLPPLGAIPRARLAHMRRAPRRSARPARNDAPARRLAVRALTP